MRLVSQDYDDSCCSGALGFGGEQLVGCGGVQVFQFQAMSAGETALQLRLQRAGEQGDDFVATVVVQ